MRYMALMGISLLCGCLTMPPSPDGGSDLSVPLLDLAQPRDQALPDHSTWDLPLQPDMTEPPDLFMRGDGWPIGCDGGVVFPSASGCEGTALANTCVAAFFDPAIKCFAPACNCTLDYVMYGMVNHCWANDAEQITVGSNAPADFQSIDWIHNGVSCLTQRPDPMHQHEVVFRRGAIVLRVNNSQVMAGDAFANGVITCPDGSTLKFGYYDLEQCAGITALIGDGARGHCTAGKCP